MSAVTYKYVGEHTLNELGPDVSNVIRTFPMLLPGCEEVEVACLIPSEYIRIRYLPREYMRDQPCDAQATVLVRVSPKDKENSSSLVLHVGRPFSDIRCHLLRIPGGSMSREIVTSMRKSIHFLCTSSGI